MWGRGLGQRWWQPARRWGLLLVALLALSLAWSACQQPVTPAVSTQLGVAVDEILADPQRVIGPTVATDAEVSRVIGERVILLRSQTPDQDLLVVLSDQAARSIGQVQSGEMLHVVGTVQPVTREQIEQVERQLGIDLDEDQLINLANQAPFIIVQSASK